MQENCHASFMLEYTHSAGDQNRLWMVVGDDGSARGVSAYEVTLPHN